MALNSDDNARILKLIEDMTLSEKVAQLQGIWLERKELENEAGEFVSEHAGKYLAEGISQIGRPTEEKTPLEAIRFINDAQAWIKQNTRLGIPTIYHDETLHGHMAEDATSFPQSIAIASSWDADLAAQISAVIADETRARGITYALGPVLDVAKDPRWGRFEETYGEDPYLTAAIGVAVVDAMQGEGEYLAENKVLATLKHLAGHGYPSGGQNTAPANIGERYLREQLLPPFEQVIRRLNVGAVMASYNELDGVPSHANANLLKTILRDEWGFEGSVLSDYFAIDQLISEHGIAKDKAQAALITMKAGVDVELPLKSTFHELIPAVESGQLPASRIDEALYRVLRDKTRVGLFDQDKVDERGIERIGTEANKALSQHAAEQSIVLLKNNGILPLNVVEGSTVALIGPHVNEVILGGYSDLPSESITLADAMRQALPDSVTLLVEPGMRLTQHERQQNKSDDVRSYSKERWNIDTIDLVSDEDNAASIAKAKAAAELADIIILSIGENEGVAREGWEDKHRGDRSSLSLSGSQPLLVDAVVSANKPIITVLENGKPIALGDELPHFSAVIEAWYGGERSGAAIANVIMGNVNPSGKLPVTFPRSAGQIPIYYNRKPSASRGYVHEDNSPLFPFGFGLSYSEFSYSDINVEKSELGLDDHIKIRCTVSNTSDVDGQEIVQLYISDPVATITQPTIALKGFHKLMVPAQQSRNVQFSLPVKALHFWGLNMKRVIEVGDIELKIGGSSADIALTSTVVINEAAEYENTETLPYFSTSKHM